MAIEESELWLTMSLDERKQYDNSIRKFWKMFDNRSTAAVEERRALYLVGSEPLWEAVDKGLSLPQAVIIARQAKLRNRSIPSVLAEYFRDPEAFRKGLKNGAGVEQTEEGGELLVDHYKMAVEETEGWAALPVAERKKFAYLPRNYWQTRGRVPGQVEMRRTLLLANSDRLWQAVARGLPLRTAADLVSKANKEKRQISEILAEEIGPPSSANGGGEEKKPEEKAEKKNGKRSMPVVGAEEWAQLEEAALRAVKAVLVGEEAFTVDYLVGRFMSDVKLAITDLKRILRAEGEKSVMRHHLVKACRVLGVDPPRLGGLVPEQARRNARNMMRDLHPDRTGGDKDKEEVFRQVAEALRLIEAYNEQCKKGE